MVRVKIIKNTSLHKAGEIVEVTPNIAHGLIDSGVAVLSKDMLSDTDYATKRLKTTRNRPRKQK